jgi:carbon-monoxide dehydrogenase medium subunit
MTLTKDPARMGFRSCQSKTEALEALAEFGEDARILAGGTDLMIQYQRGEINPALLVHIRRIARLRGVNFDGPMTIGALTTHRQLATDKLVRRHFPALAEGAATVGGWQTQEAGTVGGNLCNASPAADTVPPLLVADAIVHLASSRERRSMTLDKFLLERRHTARQPDELLTGIELAPTPSHSGEVYLKVGPRRAMEVALVGLAVRLTFGEDSATVTDARIAACSVGPRPFRAAEAEAVLIGSRLEAAAVAEAGQLLTRTAQPIDDVRATASYRLRVLAPLLGRAVEECRVRAGGR